MSRAPAHDDPAQVVLPIAGPVPHIEGMHAVVGVGLPVEAPVALIVGIFGFETLFDFGGVTGLREDVVVEVDVGGVVGGIEPLVQGMGEDEHPAPLDERFAPVHVEAVAEGEGVDKQGVEEGVDVVGAKVGKTHDHYVGLAFGPGRSAA